VDSFQARPLGFVSALAVLAVVALACGTVRPASGATTVVPTGKGVQPLLARSRQLGLPLAIWYDQSVWPHETVPAGITFPHLVPLPGAYVELVPRIHGVPLVILVYPSTRAAAYNLSQLDYARKKAPGEVPRSLRRARFLGLGNVIAQYGPDLGPQRVTFLKHLLGLAK
jgi:hypothetical protein